MQLLLQLQATSKGIFRTVHKISPSHCISHIDSGPLGRLFLSATFNPLPGPSTYQRTSLLQNSKAASLFFRAHTFLIPTGKMPSSLPFPFQNPFSHFNEFDVFFHRICSLAALVLIIIVLGAWNRSTIPKHRAPTPPSILFNLFLGTLQFQSITTIFSASSATSLKAGSFRRRQRSWKPIDQKKKLLFLNF